MQTAYDYLTFRCDPAALEGHLKNYGKNGWRLHTCEPIIIVGQMGGFFGEVFVVMDKAYVIDTTAIERPKESAIPRTAIGMKS